MPFAFGSAITWALETVVLSMALSHSVFSAGQAFLLASFISAFLNDLTAAAFMWVYMGVKRQLKGCWRALRSKSGKWMILAALLGAPVGMSGYVMAINNIGPAYTAAISAFYPAFGAFLSYFVMKEKFKPYQWGGLFLSLAAIAVLGWTPDTNVPGSWGLGLAGALMTVIGWGSEAVIMAYGMQEPDVTDEHALLIRETTSAISYGAIIIPLMGGLGASFEVFTSGAMPIIAIAGVAGVISYLFYYKAIVRMGPARAMSVNITYSAWAIPIGFLLVGSMPSIVGIVCALVIICGSIICAADLKQLFGIKDKDAPSDDDGQASKDDGQSAA